jgi:hypothetical protein
MDNLSCGSWKREGRDIAKQRLIEYFIELRYGQKYFSSDEIMTIFKEMDAIGMLYPKNAPSEILELHNTWRENYQEWWFGKWSGKVSQNQK